MNKNLTIVGCGNVGSMLVYNLILKSLDCNIIDSINLIDFDRLEESNLPYILGKDYNSEFLNLPKVFILKNFVSGINTKIKINSFESKYEELNLSDDLKNSILIDCRDSKDEKSEFKFKLNLDGSYGTIIINPETRLVKNRSKYFFKSSQFYSNIFSSLTCNFIFNYFLTNEEFKERKKYSIDLNTSTEFNCIDESKLIKL